MNKPQQDQPVRPAATVIIVRDAKPQFEIFMLRRTNKAAFAGGMYVFPGGRVDESDHSALYAEYHSSPAEQQADQRQALGVNWRAYLIAGIRETFEESGFLLAYNQQGETVAFDASNSARFEAYRTQLHDGELGLLEICKEENLQLAIDQIHFYNRWITPAGKPRRFDTRFFITGTPANQSGLHDGKETVDSIWISPNEALALNAKEEFGLMGVTQKQLSLFAKYETASDFLSMAANNLDFPTNNPSGTPLAD
ncbi:MAG: hypothetical protein KUG79_01450 [Pseudomonadales bacterium]|nr:hypothetical protein [Pseudomonadales bacterium]